MSCARLSLLTNVTRPPRVMVTLVGLIAPFAPIVMVAVPLGVPVGGGVVGGVGAVGVDGVELLPPPQAAAIVATRTAAASAFQIVCFMVAA